MAGLKSRPFESEVDGAILSGPRGGGGESLRLRGWRGRGSLFGRWWLQGDGEGG